MTSSADFADQHPVAGGSGAGSTVDRFAEIKSTIAHKQEGWGAIWLTRRDVEWLVAALEAAQGERDVLKRALQHKMSADCHADDGTHHSGCPGWERMRDADLAQARATIQIYRRVVEACRDFFEGSADAFRELDAAQAEEQTSGA